MTVAQHIHSTYLEDRFCALWDRCLCNGLPSNAKSLYHEISACYCEPHRSYHTLDHLGHALKQLDRVSIRLDDRDAVEMALWFHDIVYKPGCPTNELESAKLFSSRAKSWLPPNLVSKVYDLILVTTHREIPRARDARYISDIDLSSLGLPWKRFRKDTKAVRKEQSHLTDQLFYPSHVRFLRFLIARPRIFYTDHFFCHHEHFARQNIDRFLRTVTEKLAIDASIVTEARSD